MYLKNQVKEEFEKHQAAFLTVMRRWAMCSCKATIFQQFPDKFPADAFTYDNYVAAWDCTSCLH